jgi:cytochrome c peroxidase
MDREKGDRPALDAAEIADLVAFLGTLDDGYSATAGGPPRHDGDATAGDGSERRDHAPPRASP